MNKKVLFFGVLAAFLVMGFLSMQRALPDAKEERIFKAIHLYSPYKVEKNIGGLVIIDSRSGIKEKPSNADVLHRIDELEKSWGHKHLTIDDDQVIIMGENNQSVAKVFIETDAERLWLDTFYGIK